MKLDNMENGKTIKMQSKKKIKMWNMTIGKNKNSKKYQRSFYLLCFCQDTRFMKLQLGFMFC